MCFVWVFFFYTETNQNIIALGNSCRIFQTKLRYHITNHFLYFFKELPADHALIKQWKEDNKLFVETEASKEVERLINCQNTVIVTGHTGSGKSAIVHHIALKYKSQGWNVKPVRTVMEMIQTINSPTNIITRKVLFVFDDPIGKESFEEMEYTTWKKYEETLRACLKKVKLLMSCRKYILNDYQVTGLLKDGLNIVDISNDQLKLSEKEKEKIWRKYSLNENISRKAFTKIIQTEAYFPLLCKLCSSKKFTEPEKLRFFTRPVAILEDEIKMFRKSFKEKYCALVLLVLFNNDFCVDDIPEFGISKDKYELALKLCGLNFLETTPHTIDNGFKTLRGFFVQKLSDNYHFYHDFVMEVTTKVFGKQYPLQIIKYADIGFLRKRVTLKCLNDNSDHFTIHLKDKYIESLAKRLFVDIFGERLLDVVLNPCLKNEKVIDVVINELEKHPEKLRLLLEKKKLQIDTQEVSHASNHLFLSKLVFVSLEETISPLSAIIIFCDSRLILPCLKILQKEKPEDFIGNSLLSSVCCNGSNDFSSMFLKDHVKTSLAEKWKYLFPIHIASAFNNNDILRELLENGADVNQKTANENYWTPLTLAVGTETEEKIENEKITSAQSRRNEMIELLLRYGADIDLCKANGVSPLYIACQEGHDDIVQLFLSNGANINKCTQNGASPLIIACQEGHERIVDTLVRNGANIQSYMEDGSNPLSIACQKGYTNTVNLLLNYGADANRSLKDGTSPLFTACQEGHDNIVRMLLNNKASTNLCKTNGESPLYVACRKGYKNIVDFLLESGANANKCMKNGASPLYIACQKGHDIIVQELLRKGANINKRAADGASPLVVACQYGHEKIINVLLQNGARLDLCMLNGSSPLITACMYGHDLIVQILLNNEADINLCNRSGVGPLYISCQYGYDSIVELLLSNGVDVNQIENCGASPLHIACMHGYDNIVKILLSNGAEINLCDESGKSPLYTACEHGYNGIVQILLRKGADINLCLITGESPLHIACKNNFKSIEQLLLSNRADINSST